MLYILCLYFLYYVPPPVQCHVMSCSRSEHHWWHWNIALRPSLILVMWMTTIVLLWQSGENVWNLQRWGISYSATWLFGRWWWSNTACSRAMFLESQVCHMCSGHLCDCTSCPLSHFSGNRKHTRITRMSGVTSLNTEIWGCAKGVVLKWRIRWTLAILWTQLSGLLFMSDDGEASSFCNMFYPKWDNVQCPDQRLLVFLKVISTWQCRDVCVFH